jgi:cysteinyl-tRNA synthetase
VFPHHEDEIAQSEAGYGKEMAKHWMHNGMITVDGKKMGKSLGNFKNIEDLEFPSMAIRYFVVSNHYRRPLDFSKTALQDAKNSYERLKRLVLGLKDDGRTNKEYLDEFKEEMDDDFNCPRAMAVLWKLVRDNKAKGKVGAIGKMDEVFGLGLLEKEEVEIPKEVLKLAKERDVARKGKDWGKSDMLRDEIKVLGFVVKDGKDGFELEENE